MKTQSWGWLTAGVLALGLNGIYHDGGAVWAHRIVYQMVYGSASLTQRASDQTGEVLQRVRTVVAHTQSQSCRLATLMAHVPKVAESPAGFVRLEGAAFRPLLISSIRIKRGNPAICPRIRVNVPRVTIPRAPVMPAAVHVTPAGAGPV